MTGQFVECKYEFTQVPDFVLMSIVTDYFYNIFYMQDLPLEILNVIDGLKSVILGISCCERGIMVENAFIIKAEKTTRIKDWGRMDFSHEMNQQDLQASVAEGILLIHANSLLVGINPNNKQVLHKR